MSHAPAGRFPTPHRDAMDSVAARRTWHGLAAAAVPTILALQPLRDQALWPAALATLLLDRDR